MRAMHFDAVKPCLLRAHGPRNKVVAQPFDFFKRQRPRAGVRIIRRTNNVAHQILGRPVARMM